jgi:hypothetical protein
MALDKRGRVKIIIAENQGLDVSHFLEKVKVHE